MLVRITSAADIWLPGISFAVEFSGNNILKQLTTSNTVTERTNKISVKKLCKQICQQRERPYHIEKWKKHKI